MGRQLGEMSSMRSLWFSWLKESLVLNFKVTVDDGNGGTDIKDVVITINGINDGPQITDASAPSEVDENQLKELSLSLKLKK